MKKQIVVFSLFASLFLVAFTTKSSSEIVKTNKNVITNHQKIGGAYLTFAGKFGGSITEEKIKKVSSLGVDGCASGSLITRFTLKIKRKKQRTQVFKGKSHVLDNKVKTALKSLKIGETFEFSSVKARLPKGGMVDVFCKKFIVVK